MSLHGGDERRIPAAMCTCGEFVSEDELADDIPERKRTADEEREER
jgi:hypothetical protein